MNNLFYNLFVAFKVFNTKGLALCLNVDKHLIDTWKDRMDNRPTGDFYNAIIDACKKNGISTDDIFSDNIIDTWLNRAREEGRQEAFRDIAVMAGKMDNVQLPKGHPTFQQCGLIPENEPQKRMKSKLPLGKHPRPADIPAGQQGDSWK